MQRHVQTELAKRFFSYLHDRATHYAPKEMEIPVEVYFDPDHAAGERELIFAKEPIIVGRSSELREPGDFITNDIVGAPLLVVRQKDGSLRAFSNVCRHRGAKVATEEKGCARRGSFKCPYHAWTYDLDGKLRSIPFGEGFDGIDTADFPLVELPVDE